MEQPGVQLTSSEDEETQAVLFKVRVAGLRKNEEVRVSGNTESLGRWDVHNSVSLKRQSDTNSDEWSVLVRVPHAVTVEYRYLLVQCIAAEHNMALHITRWETTVHPHQFCLLRPSSDSTDGDATDAPVIVEHNFGETDWGEEAQDKGWLVATTELQLQLNCSPEQEPAVRIDTIPDHTPLSIKIKFMDYCSKTFDACKSCQCSPIELKILDSVDGDCRHVDQEDRGFPFLPHQMMVFTTQAPDFNYCAFIVDIYAIGGGGEGGGEQVGRASILPQQLAGDYGNLVLTVFSPALLPVGTITFTYLIIKPVLEYPRIHRARYSFANYWKKHKRPLDIGHRGLGSSFATGSKLKPTQTENTIASLKQAGAHGADYVEFDVQLTRDLVPVVYHDFTVCTTLAKKGFLSGELYEVFIKDLTLVQLQNLQLDHTSVLSRPASPTSSSPSPSPMQSRSPSPSPCNETVWRFRTEDAPEAKTFPTLEEVFRQLPRHVGFNIELKYPVPCEHERLFHYFPRNTMADIVLNVVYRVAHRRKIIFSSFDPDMCTILKRKQPKYPVLFLSTGGRPEAKLPVEMRSRTLKEAVMFARSENLLGINVDSYFILREPGLIRTVTDKGLVLFTYGEDNNNTENIELQKKNGVAAVIYDRITHHIPQQKNVFQEEEEEAAQLHKLFGLKVKY